MEKVLIEILNRSKRSSFYGNRRFRGTRHLILAWVRWVLSTDSYSCLFYANGNIIFPFTPMSSTWYIRLDFPTTYNSVCNCHFSYVRHRPLPTFATLLMFQETHVLWRLSSCCFVHHSVPSNISGTNTVHRTLLYAMATTKFSFEISISKYVTILHPVPEISDSVRLSTVLHFCETVRLCWRFVLWWEC
jgi:hypothetical protein